MSICDFGCGQEAKYHFKNGKHCCSKSWNSCKKQIELKKTKLREVCKKDEYRIKQRENTLNYLKNERLDSKNDRIQKIKDGMKHNHSGKKISEKAKKRLEDPDYIKNLSIKAIERFKDINERKKLSEKFRFTIEKIKEKYPFFLEIEELRYNPEKLDQKEIQVRCKNSNCKNSKEKDGWFSPTGPQITNRIFVSKKLYGRSYFFCSEKCKQECELFNRRVDPETYKEYWKYYKRVIFFTNRSVKNNYDKIVSIELRGLEWGYDLDHKYSIYDGFMNDIDPKIIGHYKNLEILKNDVNRNQKGKKSSIKLEELLKEIENI